MQLGLLRNPARGKPYAAQLSKRNAQSYEDQMWERGGGGRRGLREPESVGTPTRGGG